MRSFSKKLAFVLALALVLTGFAPAATAKAADDFSLNRTAQTLYANEGVNDKGSETLADGLYGNVQKYDFNLKNKPADWKTAYSYKWASSDEKVATVNNSGLTTAVGVGKAVITCIVTEKATGSVAADLKATVQVKANAAKVEIYAADGNDYDGTTVAAGTIDFNRNMFDAAGNKTNKKGTYVTDLTRWVVEPANKGVTVNQANGVVTVAEDAKGEYTVYAETYQSEKYNQVTATSNKVTFTVGGDSFEVKQTTVKKFTVNFDAKVSALTTDDVVVNKLYKGFEIPALVKTVTLAKDGMSAEVEMFVNLAKDNEYVVNVAGFEALTFVAAGGDPVEVLIYVDEKEIGKEAAKILDYIQGL
jgi:ribosomal protein L23